MSSYKKVYGVDSMNIIGDSRASDVQRANKVIEKAKRDYEVAKSRGDRKGMEAAHERAEQARKEGGTIRETDKLRETKTEKKDTVHTEKSKGEHKTAARVEISAESRKAYEVAQKNKEIDQAKREYATAQRRGDTKGMEAAHKRAEQLRKEGGTLKATDPSKERREYEVAKKNLDIEKAKRDYEEAKRRGDTKGMEAAHQRAEQLRKEGGTIKAEEPLKTPKTSMADMKKADYNQMEHLPKTSPNTNFSNKLNSVTENAKAAAVETAKMTVAFTTGVMDAVSESATYGAYQGKVPSGYGNSYYGGKIVGNAAVTVGGAIETLAGGSLFGGGVALDATGVGAIPGVAANAAGAAMVAHGSTVATTGAANFGKDAKNLYNNITGKSSNGVDKAKVLQDNKAKGQAYENKVIQEMNQTHSKVKQQITVKTESGTKTRLDVVGTNNKTGKIELVEVKSSTTAPLTQNQKKAFPEIEKTGGTVVGKGKEPYTGGTHIPPTKVEVKRPKK